MTWRCFFCDQVFIDHELAREHFQRDRNDKPECIRRWAAAEARVRKDKEMDSTGRAWSFKTYEVLGWHFADHNYGFEAGDVWFTGELDFASPVMVRETYDHGKLVGVCVQMLYHDIQICSVWVNGYAEPCLDLTRRAVDRAGWQERG